MVIAHHLIWTGYGWWLPNDPRGSGSQLIRKDILAELGALHFGRKRIQPAGREIRQFMERAAPRLEHQTLTFDEMVRQEIGAVFGDVIRMNAYTCYACAVMPDHVHLVIRKHRHLAEEMMEALKDASREHLRGSGLVPARHPVWTGGLGWKVFLNRPDEVRRTIRYAKNNPIEIDLPAQEWSFVREYDGWPLHRKRTVED
ncbi:hypothetical protein AYO40_05970 [Planctomycetaceae bacterium SCGC AG-212-D15]|nr:hypothetical protein AYO40_05970 [Planctomycetaceae bacterium SCGC AG-212-D15]